MAHLKGEENAVQCLWMGLRRASGLWDGCVKRNEE